jgi:hypothetical protein
MREKGELALQPSQPRPFSICFGNDLVVADWTGFPSAEAIRASYEEAMAQPEFRDGMPILAIIQPQVPPPPSDHLRHIPVIIAPYHQRTGPLALVVKGDIHMGLARMLSSYCHMAGLQVEVFTTIQTAHDWLCSMPGRCQKAKVGGDA